MALSSQSHPGTLPGLWGMSLLQKKTGRWKEPSLGKRAGVGTDRTQHWGYLGGRETRQEGHEFEVAQAQCECHFPAAGSH